MSEQSQHPASRTDIAPSGAPLATPERSDGPAPERSDVPIYRDQLSTPGQDNVPIEPESFQKPVTFNLQPATASAASADPLTPDPQPSTLNPQLPPLPRFPGETPRAFSAFKTFFELGHSRSLPAVADLLGENHDTVRRWSSRFRWSDRLHSLNSGLLHQQAAAQAAARAEHLADWARRATEYREHEWETSQKVLAAIQCFLDDFSDQHVAKMSLSQVSRALQIVSTISRSTLSGAFASDEPTMAPIQIELTAALKKAYSNPEPPKPATASSQP